MTTLALLSLLSSLAGWLYALIERGRRISAEKRAERLSSANKTMVASIVESTRIMAAQRRELATMRKAPLSHWESAHFVGEPLQTFADTVNQEK